MQDISDVSLAIWQSRYRAPGEQSISDSRQRVAAALAAVEPLNADHWAGRFLALLDDCRFLPGGRILAGTGSGLEVTLFNCFVMGPIADSMEGIFEALKEGALTMQQGGGIGYDFSTLRPTGSRCTGGGGIASGPVSFMAIWDRMCATLLSTAARRGAMMATLRCDHPDIEAFIDAKRQGGLSNFNLSVLVSDDFMSAVANDTGWPLLFPEEGDDGERIHCRWPGRPHSTSCRVYRRVPARDLWRRIMQAAYDSAEPGVLFIDRINRLNNLGYRESISATNPCGEVPLPPYGACNLGSLNLTRFVRRPFSPEAAFDLQALAEASGDAVRLLDNVIDVSRFPLPAQAEQARGSRRIGLGITGLADALILLGLHYGEPAAREQAALAMRTIRDAAYRTSVALAREKGEFPFIDRQALGQQPFIQALPTDIQQAIAEYGLRNSHLTAIAPTGTISLLAGNVSSGIEPVFDFVYTRRIRSGTDNYSEYPLSDYALRLWRDLHGERPLPPSFITARQLQPQAHLAMQAALQPYVDNAISKTINVPEDYEFDAFASIYREAYELGLKGCTTFRRHPTQPAVLSSAPQEPANCCGLDREND